MLPIAAALPSGEASKYVATAYIVFVVLIVVYVAIMAAKLQRIERELRELAGFAEHRANGEGTVTAGENDPSDSLPPAEVEEVTSDG
jgi:CcmD family protein